MMCHQWQANLYAALGHQFGKVFEGAVHGTFGVIREATCRQLSVLPVIGNAFAAGALSRTRLMGTIASF
jgi:hypothetical protein